MIFIACMMKIHLFMGMSFQVIAAKVQANLLQMMQ